MVTAYQAALAAGASHSQAVAANRAASAARAEGASSKEVIAVAVQAVETAKAAGATTVDKAVAAIEAAKKAPPKPLTEREELERGLAAGEPYKPKPVIDVFGEPAPPSKIEPKPAAPPKPLTEREELERGLAAGEPYEPKPPVPSTLPKPLTPRYLAPPKPKPPPPPPPKPGAPTLPPGDKISAGIAEVAKPDYKPGSTMYERGFRTQEEYVHAQKAGVRFGVHEGNLVPAGSVILEVRGILKDPFLVRYSGEKGTAAEPISASVFSGLKREDYRVPITATSETGETATMLLSAKEATRIDKLSPEAQFEAYKALGVFPSGAQFRAIGDKKWGVATERQSELEVLAKKYALPGDKFNLPKAVEDKVPEKDLVALGFTKKDIVDYRSALTKYEANQAALTRLGDYTKKEYYIDKMLAGGGVDGAKYLRDHEGDTQTLRDAGFTPSQIKSWQDYNKQPFVGNTIIDYYVALDNAGVKRIRAKAPLFSDVPFIHTWEYPKGFRLEDHPEITLPPMGKREKPAVSLQRFTSEFINARSEKELATITKMGLSLESLARSEYNRLYGGGALISSGMTGIASLVFVPARALHPEVVFKDISGMEWAIGGAQVALLGLPLIGKGIAALATPLVSRLAVSGVGLAAGGVFTAETVRHWDKMTPTEKKFAVAIDTIIIGASLVGLGAIARAKLGTLKAAKVSAATNKAINSLASDIRKALPKKVVKGSISYRVAKSFMEQAIREASMEIVKVRISRNVMRRLYREAGLSEAVIRELMKPKLFKLTQRLTKESLQKLSSSFKEGNERFLRARLSQITKEIPKIPEPTLSRATVRRLYMQAGLSRGAINELMQPRIIRLSRRLTEKALLKLGKDFKEGNERFLRARISQVGRELYKPLPPTITRAERLKLYRQAGLSDFAIKELMKPKILRLTQQMTSDQVEKLIQSFKEGNRRFLTARLAQVARETPKVTEPILTRAERLRLYQQAGLGEATIKELLKPKMVKITQRLTKESLQKLSSSIKDGNERFLRARLAQVAREMPTITKPLPRNEMIKLYRQAGLSDFAIKELMKPQLLKVTQRLTREGLQKIARDFKEGNDRFLRARIEQVSLDMSLKVEVAMPRAEKIRLLREAGLSEAVIKDIMTPKLLRMSKRQFLELTNKLQKSVTGAVDDIKRGANDALKEAGLKSPEATLRTIDIAIQKNDPLLLKEGARRLQITGAYIPKQLGGGMLQARARLLLANPKQFLKLTRANQKGITASNADEFAKSLEANKKHIEVLEHHLKILRKVKPEAEITKLVEKTLAEARRQVRVATKEKPLPLTSIEEFPAGKYLPARVKKPVKVIPKEAPITKEIAIATTKRADAPPVKSKPKVEVRTTKGDVVAVPIHAFRQMAIGEILPYYEVVSEEDLVLAIAATSPTTQRRIQSLINTKFKADTKAMTEAEAKAAAAEAKVETKAMTEAKAMATAKAFLSIKPVEIQAPAPAPAPAPKPALAPAPVPPPTKEPLAKKPPPIPLLPRASDEEKRKAISDSKGAIAWRQGELGGKDVWHTIKYPYRSEADYLTVLGRKPSNTTIVTGPGSAYETIKLRYGKAPAKKVTGDIGFMDFFIEPTGKREVGIGFTADPKMETVGDITIGRPKVPPITERPPRFSGRGIIRITPKRPPLRR